MPELRLTDERLTFLLETDAYVDPAVALGFMQRLAQEDMTIAELRLTRGRDGSYTLSTERTSGRNLIAKFSPVPSSADSRVHLTQAGEWSIEQTRYALRFTERIIVPAILTLGIARLTYSGQPSEPAPLVRE